MLQLQPVTRHHKHLLQTEISPHKIVVTGVVTGWPSVFYYLRVDDFPASPHKDKVDFVAKRTRVLWTVERVISEAGFNNARGFPERIAPPGRK